MLDTGLLSIEGSRTLTLSILRPQWEVPRPVPLLTTVYDLYVQRAYCILPICVFVADYEEEGVPGDGLGHLLSLRQYSLCSLA